MCSADKSDVRMVRAKTESFLLTPKFSCLQRTVYPCRKPLSAETKQSYVAFGNLPLTVICVLLIATITTATTSTTTAAATPTTYTLD